MIFKTIMRMIAMVARLMLLCIVALVPLRTAHAVVVGDKTTVQVDIISPSHGAVLNTDDEADAGAVLARLPVQVEFRVDGDAQAFGARHAASLLCLSLDVGVGNAGVDDIGGNLRSRAAPTRQQVGCMAIAKASELVVRNVPPGRYELFAWVQDQSGKRVGYIAENGAVFEVRTARSRPSRRQCPFGHALHLIEPQSQSSSSGGGGGGGMPSTIYGREGQLDITLEVERPQSCDNGGDSVGTGACTSADHRLNASVRVCASIVAVFDGLPERNGVNEMGQRHDAVTCTFATSDPDHDEQRVGGGGIMRARLFLGSVAPGRYTVCAWVAESSTTPFGDGNYPHVTSGEPHVGGGRRCGFVFNKTCDALTTATAEVFILSPPRKSFPNALTSPYADSPCDLTVVSAVSEKYVSRLANLAGSLHWWSPEVCLVVYSLEPRGLSAQAAQWVSRWRNTELRQFPFERLPPHARQLSSFAFKPWVLLDALQRAPSVGRQNFDNGNNYNSNANAASAQSDIGTSVSPAVLWLDASIEIRQPLSWALVPLLRRDGHFFTVSGFHFPTPHNVFGGTLDRFGCNATLNGGERGGTEASGTIRAPDPLRECAGGYQGYVKGTWAHKHVLQPLVQCALDAQCLTPSGSSRANHRQDQSILNALLCRHVQENRLSGMPCQRDRRWWMWDDQSTLLPPKNETQWRDDLVFFLRRSTVVQPYLRHLVEEQNTHKKTEQQVPVGQDKVKSVDSDDDGVLFFS